MKKILLSLLSLILLTQTVIASVDSLPEVRGVLSGSREVSMKAYEVVILSNDLLSELPDSVLARALVGRAGEFTMPAWNWPTGEAGLRTQMIFKIYDQNGVEIAKSIQDHFRFKYTGEEIQKDLYKSLIKDLAFTVLPEHSLFFETPKQICSGDLTNYVELVAAYFNKDFSSYKYSSLLTSRGQFQYSRASSQNPGDYFWSIGTTIPYLVTETLDGIEFKMASTAVFFSPRIFDKVTFLKRTALVELDVTDKITGKSSYYFLNPTKSLTSLFPEYEEDLDIGDFSKWRSTKIELLKPENVRDF